jgi:Ni,Fe-hydrogenase maturation factor
MVKIICLGNEFIEEDFLAKNIGKELKDDFEIINIKDSFQLMSILNDDSDFVLLDVVQGLDKVCLLGIKDLKKDTITSAHDFDAAYVLKLLNKDVKIIGIPITGDSEEIKREVIQLIKSI